MSGETFSFEVQDNEDNLKQLDWTPGELLVGRRLESNPWLREIGELEDRRLNTVWGQTEIRGPDKRVDFLVFTPDMLVVIEVKDHKSFKSDITKPWSQSKHAWKQCREYVKELKRQVGGYLPVIGIVAFPFLEKEENSELAQEINSYGQTNWNIHTWFAHESQKGQYKVQLKKAQKQLIDANNRVNNPQMVCAMAEIIDNISVEPDVSCTEDLPLSIYDHRQIQLSHNYTTTGDRIVYGVAGSGKTMIIINRAKQYSSLHPNKETLVVCFNKPLQQFLENQLRSYPIEVRTIHSWYRSILQRWGSKLHKKYLSYLESPDPSVVSKYFDKLPEALEKGLEEGNNLPSYHAILVDEGQDFEEDWFRHLKLAHIKDDPQNLFLVCLDSMQAIHKREKNQFHWSDVNINARGRTKYLRKNYRNRSEVAKYAIEKLDVPDAELDEENVNQYVEIEELPRKGGEIKVISTTPNNMISTVAKEVNEISDDYSIMIVYDYIRGPKRLEEIESEVHGRKVYECITNRNAVIPNGPIVPIYSVHRSKGLEADVVIFVHRPGDKQHDIDYVAITRAREKIVEITVE